MNNKQKILLVEDNEIAAIVATEVLSPEYDVRHVENGQAALDYLSQELPDLVLLDVDMPGMSGYEACRVMRDNPAFGDLPVIFLSGMVSKEDRLAGYEAGGDDYLTKPASADELCTKIKLQLESYAERRRLKQDLSTAFSTAMTAMSSSAEIGAILQFMRTSFSCPDYTALCREVLNTLSSYGLEAIVQIRGQQETVSLGANGPCSPLEISVLNNMSDNGRLFEFATRTSCSFDHITIIVKSERNDPDRHGRMKDNLVQMAEAADSRVVSLDNEAVVAKQRSALKKLAASTSKALQGIEQGYRKQGIKSREIFHELQQNIDRSLLTLGVTQSQEEELSFMIENAANQAHALYSAGLEISAHMESILEQLESAGK